MTPITKEHPNERKDDVQEPIQQQPQVYKRWESHYSTWRKKEFQPLLQSSTTTKILMRESTTTNTYKDKGKCKAIEESNVVPEYPKVVVAQEVHQLIKKSMDSSSATPTEALQEAKPASKRHNRVYQPKFSSPRAQQRSQSKQVLVPKQMLEARRLCNGDEHKWVEL